MNSRRALVISLIAALAGLVCYSFHLAANRILQVDECMEISIARDIATGGIKNYTGLIPLLQLPLALVIRGIEKSADIFVSARFFMAEIFWLNIVLLAVATGEKLFSRRGLVALFFAATLAPVWDHGFEIRHDNPMLTGVLIMWCLARLKPPGIGALFTLGALVVILQFTAHKAFAYTVPISLAALAFPHAGSKLPRWKMILAWLGGLLVAFVVLKLFYSTMTGARFGHAQGEGVDFVASVATGSKRFLPTLALSRLLTQTPLLLALCMAALVSTFADWRRNGRSAFTWDGSLPESLLCLGALALLFVNPTPFPYNLLHVAPFAFLLAWRFIARLDWTAINRPPWTCLGICVLIFAHLVPFTIATKRHLDWSNLRQVQMMTLAEELTDAKADPVFDGAGLVPTRPRVDDAAFLHSLSFEAQMEDGSKTVSKMLTKVPAPVLMKNYRTDWLSADDQSFIATNYVAVSDEFHVLGKVLPPGGGEFRVTHPGRYRITPYDGSNLMGTFANKPTEIMRPSTNTLIAGSINGATISNAPVQLAVGAYTIKTAPGEQAAIFWVGPKLNTLPRLENGNHRWLFFNWY